MRVSIWEALFVHQRLLSTPTTACSKLAQYDDALLKSDGADSLLIISKGAHNILFQLMIAFKFPVTCGQNSKDKKLRSHSNQNSSKPLTIEQKFETFMCARRL